MENRWWSEVENWGNLGMGDLVPGETQARPGGALSAVATQSKQGQQNLKVVPSHKSQLSRLVLVMKRKNCCLGLNLNLTAALK